MTASPGLSPSARRLVALLSERADGLTLVQLSEQARASFQGLPSARVAALVREALAVGAIHERGGRLYALPKEQGAELPDHAFSSASAVSRPLRAVVVDVESVVRTIAAEPYVEKRIYQVGAARVGADAEWVEAAPRYRKWVELPDDQWVIVSDRVRVAHAGAAVPPAEALAGLHAFAEGADLVIAYNGTEADFPLLAEACDREHLPRLGGQYVDAYYLALAVWPTAASHRLAVLASHVGVDTSDLHWHDAGEDCVLLARVLEAAAARLGSWPPALLDLVASVAPDSPGWLLLRQLADRGAEVGRVRPFRHGEVAAVAQAALAGRPLRRTESVNPPGRLPLVVGHQLRGADGRVDPIALAAVAHGGAASRRPAQERMTAVLHEWADAGVGGLLEAPTGTGKSLAVLAAALDWLAAHPDRAAIITTYTKQLQAQLARDVATLDAAVPGLLQAADVVKGASNRLSLRALLVALADATTLELGRRNRPGSRNRFLDRLAFRELVLFLLLRLLAAADREREWSAYSVDLVDIPAFFTDYAGPALPVWLESLSQGANGDYAASASPAIAAHTDLVVEAIAGHRLILANHALLLAHLDDLAALGEDTLLIVDEAHQLEDAATSALTTTLDYRAVEDLFGDLHAWVGDHPGVPEVRAAGTAVANFGYLLEHEQLPRVASLAFDARSRGSGSLVGARTATLASPFAGTGGVPQVRTLAGLLTRLAGQCRAITGALGAVLATYGAVMDFFEVQRVQALISRAAGTDSAARAIVDDIITVFGPPPGQQAAGGSTTHPPEESGTDVTDPDDALGFDDPPGGEGETADEESGGAADPGADVEDGIGDQAEPELPVGMANQVVYAEEVEALRAGLRRYRFRIASAPIDLPADPSWRQFLATFTRTCYVSATLRIAGSWTFLRQRLGLASTIPAFALDTPFDLVEQAELVCFSDFPSWAEQADGAMRTLAHQLAGYTAEMVHPAALAGQEPQPGRRGGYDGGAMVLTTARSAAGGVADHLAEQLRRSGDDTPVHSALVVGNQRAVRSFTDPDSGGGLLVGTKGLWQGVDVADPDRLRLVWINKLPFAPFAAPVIDARRAAVTLRAERRGVEDPEAIATQTYYLPLAALQLRQAVGRLIRSERHRGVIVISDRKLGGATALRRGYRRTFLGSLDPGLLREDPDTGEPAGGNVVPMAEGWRRIWAFYARHGLLDPARAAELSTEKALDEHTLLPQTRRIRDLALNSEQVADLTARGELADEVTSRAAQVAGLLRLSDAPAELKVSQVQVIRAVAERRNVLALLPTGFGKSFCFQLPALVLPGVTLVVSPLVALMHGQALVTVAENPIRPELAVFRRSIRAAGPATVAGLAEEVLDAVDDHAIFYCLTVKEVVALHAHLREYLGDVGVQVRRFHARLTEAEKAAVMTEFREAPRKGEEGFAPLVVVATSAFGLGINRADIRTVFCVSPPTDLAALYQQLGRAGRDAAGRQLTGPPDLGEDRTPSAPTATDTTGPATTGGSDSGGPANTGLVLFTSRGLRMVAFMTGQDLPGPLLTRMGRAVLTCGRVLDAAATADRLIGEDLASGFLSVEDARSRRTAESYTAGVVRAFAALAGLGAVTDLGDFPPVVKLLPGELLGCGADQVDAGVEAAAVKTLLALPAHAVGFDRLGRARLPVTAADAHLARAVPGYRQLAGDPAATWQLLADLHDRGQLDISAAPSRRLVSGLTVNATRLPAGFAAAVTGKAARAAREVALLRDFFDDRSTCAHRKFADYFGASEVPAACCTTAANRCSACWDYHSDWPAGDSQPATARALLVDRPRLAGWRVDAAAKARRLDEQVRLLVWNVDRGLSAREVCLALRGEDSWFYAKARRRIRLPNALTTSRFFGANPAVTPAQVQDSLARLAADGRVVPAGHRWRDVDNVTREQRRRARRQGSGR